MNPGGVPDHERIFVHLLYARRVTPDFEKLDKRQQLRFRCRPYGRGNATCG
jgi:hypothetical protein